jgi:hypothetical protein
MLRGVKELMIELWYFFMDYFDYVNEKLHGEHNDD